MDKKTENELIESFDELVKVCQGCFTLLLKNDLMEGLDGLLFSANISPGFATRAEEIRRKVMRERIVEDDYVN